MLFAVVSGISGALDYVVNSPAPCTDVSRGADQELYIEPLVLLYSL